ncbi:dimethylarginine dimethylaminohydrolase family protein [Biformimicrobium ophioploci]|uniref:arginine deiminase n=1 Tax=Biformimicrobium ophioploci TaxID=3036711 RepID=A0ABQ6LWD9_9GAMM|nr:arginine deiminase family protein [Microbulbifer sp. NKW57]GMG86403.1 dimethylarginine dimethylaminohydrolase family protein [Microbulbifer sp. NKW57]
MANFTYQRRNTDGKTPELSPWGMNSEYGVLRDVLIGPMDHYSWQTGNAMSRRAIRLGREFDPKVARQQYNEMLDIYRSQGATPHFLEPDENLPYQIYARDSSVMTPWGPIVTQMYSPWRRGEWVEVVKFYQRMDIPLYDIVTAGSLEGGDFMVLEPGVILCGYTGERTSEAGLNQMRQWVEAEGWEFKSYQFDPYFLHLDVKVAMLSEKLAAVCTEAVEDELLDWFKARNIEIIDISYRSVLELGVNVVALGNDRVLIPAASTELIEKSKAHGLEVFAPDMSMFTSGGGGVHCMCQPLRRDPV